MAVLKPSWPRNRRPRPRTDEKGPVGPAASAGGGGPGAAGTGGRGLAAAAAQPRPQLRSYIVNWLKPLGADPKALIAKLESLAHDPVRPPRTGNRRMDAILFHPETSMRRALILALGNTSPTLPPGEREPLVASSWTATATTPTPGFMGRRNGRCGSGSSDEKLKKIDAELTKLKDRGDRRWYVNSQGQTLALIEGPVEFRMGSPPSRAGTIQRRDAAPPSRSPGASPSPPRR